MFYSSSLPEALVGNTLHPPPESVLGFRGALGGYQRSCRSQFLSGRAGARRFGFFWGWVGAQLGKTRPLMGKRVGGEKGTCLPTGCFANPYSVMGWRWGTVPLAHSPRHLLTRERGGFLSNHQARSTRVHPRSDLTSQLSTVSQAGIR